MRGGDWGRKEGRGGEGGIPARPLFLAFRRLRIIVHVRAWIGVHRSAVSGAVSAAAGARRSWPVPRQFGSSSHHGIDDVTVLATPPVTSPPNQRSVFATRVCTDRYVLSGSSSDVTKIRFCQSTVQHGIQQRDLMPVQRRSYLLYFAWYWHNSTVIK